MTRLLTFLLLIFSLGVIVTLANKGQARELTSTLLKERPATMPSVYLAGGCFWCTEWAFRRLDGVLFTRVGYMGGTTENPTYDDITTGQTGHAEVIEVTYDPAIITYEQILEFFFKDAHDPTQLNRQGVDRGTQYRSAIFVTTADERAKAQNVINTLQKNFKNPIVTTLEPFSTFYEGEDYHQNYYEKYKARTGQEHIRVQLKAHKEGGEPNR